MPDPIDVLIWFWLIMLITAGIAFAVVTFYLLYRALKSGEF